MLESEEKARGVKGVQRVTAGMLPQGLMISLPPSVYQLVVLEQNLSLTILISIYSHKIDNVYTKVTLVSIHAVEGNVLTHSPYITSITQRWAAYL